MNHARVSLLHVLGALVALGVPRSVAAQPLARPDAVDSYGYVFKDDLMLGDGLGPAAPRIPALRRSLRDLLLRPRTHFIPQLLKSVEEL